MILRGEALWAQSPGEEPAWTRGAWRIVEGTLRRDDAASAEAAFEGVFVPGFADGHAHIGIGEDGPVGPQIQERQALAQAESGVLAIRDAGSPVDTRWIDARQDLPRLRRAGRHLARPKRYIRGLPLDLEDPAELPEAAAAQADASDGWVKIVGDWIDRSKGADSDLEPLWPPEILREAVAAVHERGARVLVHSFAHRTIDDLLDAGVDDIEHASGMDPDQAAEAAARGILVAPTLLQISLFDEFAAQAGRKYPVYAQTMLRMHAEREDHFAMLRDAGVRLIMGTDSGGYQEHGTIGRELAAWLEAGVPRAELLDIATWRTRKDLGFEALWEGASADLLCYSADPRESGALDEPDAVILRGRVIAARTPRPRR